MLSVRHMNGKGVNSRLRTNGVKKWDTKQNKTKNKKKDTTSNQFMSLGLAVNCKWQRQQQLVTAMDCFVESSSSFLSQLHSSPSSPSFSSLFPFSLFYSHIYKHCAYQKYREKTLTDNWQKPKCNTVARGTMIKHFFPSIIFSLIPRFDRIECGHKFNYLLNLHSLRRVMFVWYIDIYHWIPLSHYTKGKFCSCPVYYFFHPFFCLNYLTYLYMLMVWSGKNSLQKKKILC